MATIYRFLANYEGLIYILLALGALFTFRWMLRSWMELREAVFGLEREYAIRRISRSVSMLVFILVLFVTELVIASFLAPSLPASDMVATPTLDLLRDSGGIPSSELSSANAENAPVPPQSNALGSGCIPGQLNLTFPSPGQEVRDTVELKGTVKIENFGFYKYEVSPQGSDTWATISAGREVVDNGTLGLWDTSVVTPGDYQLRLIAVDNQGDATTPCIVPVRVIAP
jgi:hypothetical protein